MRVLLLFLLSIGLAACSAAGVSGSVNGVEFRSAVHRPAVPGGHPGVQALAVGESGVQHRHRHREALAEAVSLVEGGS